MLGYTCSSWGCGKRMDLHGVPHFFMIDFSVTAKYFELEMNKIKFEIEYIMVDESTVMRNNTISIHARPFFIIRTQNILDGSFFHAIIHRLRKNCVNYNHLHYLILNFIYCVCVWLSSCIYSCYNVLCAIIISNVDSIFTTNNLNNEL